MLPDMFVSLLTLGVDNQATWLDDYCAGHPADVLMIVTGALLNNLAGRAKR